MQHASLNSLEVSLQRAGITSLIHGRSNRPAGNDCDIDFILPCFVCWVAYVYREELLCVKPCKNDFIVP